MIFSALLVAASTGDLNLWQAYEQCLIDNAVIYSELNEPAETIATAAEAACRSQRLRANLEAKAPRGQLAEFTARMERSARSSAVKAVLDMRLARKLMDDAGEPK